MNGRAVGARGRGSLSRGEVSLPRIRTASTDTPQFSGASAVEARQGLEIGVVSAQGRRPYQEDEYVVRPILRSRDASVSGQHTALFGIFDGHAGGRCSKAVASTIPDMLLRQPEFETNLPTALQASYTSTNQEFLKVAERLKLHDGSTGLTSILRGLKLTIANVGDCRAVLIRGGVAKQITIDHKPTDPVEQKRIAALGGKVVNSVGVARVNGVLAVSRAFGNRSIKHVIRPDADVFSVKLTRDDSYLVQASDGMWDVLRNKDVATICAKMESMGPQKIAEELVSVALARGTTDNTTAMVIELRAYTQRQMALEEKSSRGSSDTSKSSVEVIREDQPLAPSPISVSRIMDGASQFLKRATGSISIPDSDSDSEATMGSAGGSSPVRKGFLDILWSGGNPADQSRSRGSSNDDLVTRTRGHRSRSESDPQPRGNLIAPIASPIQVRHKRITSRPGTTHLGRAGTSAMDGGSPLMFRPSASPITVPALQRLAGLEANNARPTTGY